MAQTARAPGGALALGAGVWSAHFIFLLSYHLPIPVGHNILISCAGLALAAAFRHCRVAPPNGRSSGRCRRLFKAAHPRRNAAG